MIEYFLSDDVARCDQDKCPSHLLCARYLDCLPFDDYSYNDFDPNGCKSFIKKNNNPIIQKTL